MEQTDVRKEEVAGTGWETVKELAEEHIFITYRHRQQYGEGQRKGGLRMGGKWAKWEMGTSEIM